MSRLKQINAALSSRKPSGNVPFTSEEIAQCKKPDAKFELLNDSDNRRTRKQKEILHPVNNNREQTKARKGNRLFIKMSRFYMAITNKKMGFDPNF